MGASGFVEYDNLTSWFCLLFFGLFEESTMLYNAEIGSEPDAEDRRSILFLIYISVPLVSQPSCREVAYTEK
jgi:hypothetical protein